MDRQQLEALVRQILAEKLGGSPVKRITRTVKYFVSPVSETTRDVTGLRKSFTVTPLVCS